MLVSSSFNICISMDLFSSSRAFHANVLRPDFRLFESKCFKDLIASPGLLLAALISGVTGPDMSTSDSTFSQDITFSIVRFLPEEQSAETPSGFSVVSWLEAISHSLLIVMPKSKRLYIASGRRANCSKITFRHITTYYDT